MQLLVFAIVVLQSTVWLPFVQGHGPRTVVPVVVEANTMSGASMDPNACFDELSPAVVAAGAQVAICPIPGRRYPVLSGAQNIALVGYGNNAQRMAWGGASTYTVHDPSAVIADADAVALGDSITSHDTAAGPIVTSGPYTLIILPSVMDTAGASEAEQSYRDFQNQVDFAKYLWDLIRATRERGIAMDRTGIWYDSVGTGTTPAALGRHGGDFINWVATGPVGIVARGGGGFPRVLFKGRFLDPAEQFCMEPFVWVEITRLMAIPALKDEVDRFRGTSSPPVWTWNIGDGLARTFSWVGWDYLSFFAVRSTGPGVPATSSFFLLIPTDFLRLDCSFLNGRKVCSLEQEPGQ